MCFCEEGVCVCVCVCVCIFDYLHTFYSPVFIKLFVKGREPIFPFKTNKVSLYCVVLLSVTGKHPIGLSEGLVS